MKFFNKISLQTPESVELEFRLAGIGNRAYALIIDYLVLGFIIIIFLLFWIIMSFALSDLLINFIDQEQIQLWITAIMGLILFFIYIGYFIFFEVLWQGQTPGKRFVKIRVIADDAKPVRLQHAALRALLRPVDELFFLGAFFIFLGKKEKRLGDWLAGTVVIQEGNRDKSNKFLVSKEAKALATELKAIADFSQILPEDFVVIREYLQRRENMLPEARVGLSRKLADDLKEIIGLEKVPEGITSNIFLEAVYWAYHQQSIGMENE